MSSTASQAAKPAVTLPKHIPWLYIVYGFLNGFGTTLPLTVLVFFITEFTGVSPTLMATVYTVARFADLGVSMFAGPAVQRWRRVRPSLLVIPMISGFGGLISFLNPPIPIPIKAVTLIIGYCCIHFPMNFSTVATNTILMKIAGPNPSNRVAITQAQQRGVSAGRIGISLATMPLVLALLGRGLPGYFIVAVLFWIIWMIASFILYAMSAPYEPKDAPAPLTNVQRVTIPQMYKAAASNKLIIALFFAVTIAGIGAQVFAVGPMYYFRYCIGNLSWQAVTGTIAGFVAFGTSIICPIFARRIGKRNSYLFQYVWLIICYMIMMFFAKDNVYLYMVMFCVVSFGTSTGLTWGAMLWLDAAEIQLHESGVDNRPFIMSINNFPIKIGFIVSGPIVAFMLNSSGYQANPGGVGGTLANTQQFMYAWLGVTAALYLVALVIFFFGYKADEKYAAECAASNAAVAKERAAAAAAAAAAAPSRA